MSYEVELALNNALAGLVGGRVHAQVLPDRPEYPALVYWLAGSRPTVALAGESALTHWNYHVDIFTQTHKESVQLSASVRAVMRRFAYPNEPTLEVEGYEPELRVVRYMLEFEIAAVASMSTAHMEGARKRA